MNLEKELFAEEAKSLIDKIAKKVIDNKFVETYNPRFPENRNDVCVIETGGSIYNMIFMVWKDAKGKMQYEEIANGKSNEDRLKIEGIRENGRYIEIVYSGGCRIRCQTRLMDGITLTSQRFEKPWKRVEKIKKSELGLD